MILDYHKFTDNNYQIKDNIGEIFNDIQHNLIKPIKVNNFDNTYELNFELIGSSKIFGSNTSNNTEFQLTEYKNITKKDYAYIVLYFPNYDNNMNIKHDYLLSTLLVGYSLKNMNNNYDLTLNKQTGTKANVICMVTCDVDNLAIQLLKLYFDDVIIVPYIGFGNCFLPNWIKRNKETFIEIQDVTQGHINGSHGYNKVFTKLNIFNKVLFPYKKVILVDSDLFALGYFDTLFSLDVPAGWLEHRRQLNPELGVDSWIRDRQIYCKHGKPIPRMFTDIENEYASDINASLLVIAPNTTLFNCMIGELQTPLYIWFGKDKYHKGFWLGNKFFDYYLLPEQNYLTKRLSGQWKSIDMGFCSWSLDLSDAFGFTFAGFITKPWKIQSANHNYTINNISTFSQINNKLSDRSMGCKIMNNLIAKMLIDISKNKNYYNIILKEIDNTKIILDSFDPWEPEINLNQFTELKDINYQMLKNISYDQKKLLYLSNNPIPKNYIRKLLYYDYVCDNILRNLFDLDFITLTYCLLDIFHKIISEKGLSNNLFPFGNSLVSLVLFGMFDIADDDNDLLLIVKNKYVIYNLIETLLNIPHIQVYIRLQTGEFIKIVNKQINKEEMDFCYFKNIFDFNKMSFFNFSFDLCFIQDNIKKNNIKISRKILINNNQIKLPWVDVFYMIDTEPKLHFLAGKNMELSRNTFFENSTYVIESVSGRKYRIPQMKQYIKEYYHDVPNKLSYYVIKSNHNITNRPILFKLDIRNKINKDIVIDIYNYYKDILKKKLDDRQ